MVQIVIPTAGRGRRLESINSSGLPKSLVKICDKRMIDWQLESLKEIQDKEFIFIVGAKKEEVEDYLTKKNLGKVTFLNNNNYKSTNCGYSLSLALPLIKDEWIYLNSDLFFEKAMTSMFKKFLGINGVCVHYGQPTDLHTFTLSPNKYIEKWMPIDTGQTTKEDLIGRPKADGEIVGPILGKMNLASDLLTIFNNLNKKRKETISCYTLFSLVEDAKYSTIDISNFIWKEIDTKNDYYLAEKLIKDNYLDK